MNFLTISSKETRENFTKIINQVSFSRKSFIITKFGKHQAMLIPVNKQKPKKIVETKQKEKFAQAIEESFGMWAEDKY